MIEPYRPSSGSEGADFEEAWCVPCAHYLLVPRIGTYDCDLGILTAAFVYGIDEDGYPSEWVEDGRGPRCTAHHREDTP